MISVSLEIKEKPSSQQHFEAPAPNSTDLMRPTLRVPSDKKSP